MADMVVFDPATVADVATFEQPNHYSAGVRHVFVNGKAVVANGAITNERPGRALRGPGYRGPIATGTASQAPDRRQDLVVAFDDREGDDRARGRQRPRPGHRRQLPPLCRRRILRRRRRQSRGPPGQHRPARRRNPGHPVPDRRGAEPAGVPTDSVGAHERHRIETRRRHDLDGARRPRYRDRLVFHRHRRSARDGLRRPPQPRRPGVRSVRSCRARDGRGAAIQASPTGTAGPYGTESLSPPIKILKAYRRQAWSLTIQLYS